MDTKFGVIVAAPYWAMNGVNVFSANLVRGLQASGIPAHILLTERDSRLVDPPEPMMPLPADVPAVDLCLRGPESWGAHWGAMIRHLEERAPCIYIPNCDWRHSNVSPRLSDRIGIVGIVHSDDPLHYDHVVRLGRFWNGIVTTSRMIADHVAELVPDEAGRITTIPIGTRVPDKMPERQHDAAAPLRVIYHGGLIQYQKRILDLPRIVEAVQQRGIPIELTVVGDGADRERLETASRHLVAQGVMRLRGVLPHAEVLALLETQDVFILTSEFEGMPNALGEAMGRGCVPVVTDVRSGIPELVRDGDNGFLVPVGGIEIFAERLTQLCRDARRRQTMASRARKAVIEGGFRTEDMVQRYIDLFHRVLEDAESGRYRRPQDIVRMPPYRVAGINILENHRTTWFFSDVGVFPSHRRDYEDYRRELIRVETVPLPKWRRTLGRAMPSIVVSLTSGRISGVDVFSANLVRSLRERRLGAHVLLTPHDKVAPDPMPVPADVPVARLPVGPRRIWRARWNTLVRYLEERRPCVYVPNYDWRYSCVSPRLSNQVGIVGIVHSDDPLHYEHVSRLGRYWNAIVAVSPAIATRVCELDPSLEPRLTTIPYGVPVSDRLPARRSDASAPLRIVYAGRFVQEQKRIFDLLQVVLTLFERRVPVEVTFLGGGQEQQTLTSACARFVAEGRVRFPGTLDNDSVLRVFEQSDVFVLTSEFEGLPVSLLEAMGRGCVPVVTDMSCTTPGVVRDGENGYRLPVGDVPGFVGRLTHLQEDGALRRQMSRAAHATVRTGGYDLDSMVDRYLALFEQVLRDAEAGAYRRPAGKVLPPASLKVESTWIGYLPHSVRVAGRLGRRLVHPGHRLPAGAGQAETAPRERDAHD